MPQHRIRHGQKGVDILMSGLQWHKSWALPCHMRRTNHLAKNVGSTTIFGKLCTWIEFYPSKTGESVIYSSSSPSPICQIIKVPSTMKIPLQRAHVPFGWLLDFRGILWYYSMVNMGKLSFFTELQLTKNPKNNSSSLFVVLSCRIHWLPLDTPRFWSHRSSDKPWQPKLKFL